MQFQPTESKECDRLLRWGLEEDLDLAGDITSQAVIGTDQSTVALLVARQDGIVAGLPSIAILQQIRGGAFRCELLAEDGRVSSGQPLARLSGPTREILAIERTVLNLLCRLSGVATQTGRYVAAVQGTKAQICDTRKTTPGWRHLEKYAVRVGGGANHRIGLFDGVLIKDNHLAAIARHQKDPVRWAIEQARQSAPSGVIIEVEVDSLTQLESALSAQPDIVLLDNMPNENLSLAVEMRDMVAPGVLLEASGGISLDTVASIARTGVDRISVGAITHSTTALDLALDDEAPSA